MLVKACENLESAGVMEQYEYYDSAASRAYYAVYQAGWYFLAKGGETTPVASSGDVYWPHRSICNALENAGMRPFDDWDAEFDMLQNLRVKADYQEDSVSPEEFDGMISKAERIVEWVKANAGA